MSMIPIRVGKTTVWFPIPQTNKAEVTEDNVTGLAILFGILLLAVIGLIVYMIWDDHH